MLIQLKIEKSDLEGTYLSTNNCPIARAFRRTYRVKKKFIRVSDFDIKILNTGERYLLLNGTGTHSHVERIRDGDKNHVILQKCERT